MSTYLVHRVLRPHAVLRPPVEVDLLQGEGGAGGEAAARYLLRTSQLIPHKNEIKIECFKTVGLSLSDSNFGVSSAVWPLLARVAEGRGEE